MVICIVGAELPGSDFRVLIQSVFVKQLVLCLVYVY